LIVVLVDLLGSLINVFPPQHAVASGNQKPKRLREAENKVWLSLFKMASGMNQEEELSKLVGELDNVQAYEEEPLGHDWFVQCMFDSIPIINMNCS
jgi:hypothetical protein